jgi:hypothetical protein
LLPLTLKNVAATEIIFQKEKNQIAFTHTQPKEKKRKISRVKVLTHQI